MTQTTRELVLARRKAISTTGKAGLPGGERPAPICASVRPADDQPAAMASATIETAGVHSSSSTGRVASLARRRAMSSHGKAGLQSKDRMRSADMNAVAIPDSTTTTVDKQLGCDDDDAIHSSQTTLPLSGGLSVNRPRASMSAARAASRARRQLTSSRGKAGISSNGMSPAQAVCMGSSGMSGRDMSKAVREQRSKSGNPVGRQSRPCGRVRPLKNSTASMARDALWKVGASETARGRTVTGTMVGYSPDVTGSEAGTCRNITGTKYLGADMFRDFCQTGTMPHKTARVMAKTSQGSSISANRMGHGENATMKVTGDNIGRSARVIGDKSGMARELTGTRYMTPVNIGNAPAKVGMSATLRHSGVTGTMIGRRDNMTGDEVGSCHNITGDDYIGQEQFTDFCKAVPAPQDQKAGVSSTGRGNAATGTMTGRFGRVTGNEPGTCKVVTGTSYAGPEQVTAHCEAPVVAAVKGRTHPPTDTPGPAMSGRQSGVNGIVTGADKGVCESVTGTPYIGADQFANACPATPADVTSPDLSQKPESVSWGRFSVTPPSGGAAHAKGSTGVAGNRFEARRDITGPFGMANGKVTGTEEMRSGGGIQSGKPHPVAAKKFEGRTKARITGEGQDAGLRITGNDWVRNHHVTGTEGRSAALRNPTIRMGMVATMAVEQKRNEALPVPNSRVTGGSGNTAKGSLITYSGGARG